MADQVLHSGVRSITDLMVLPGLINLDFADVRTVMTEMGKAMMGTGEASGEGRALMAAENAIQNPLLDEVTLKGAKAVLVNITGGLDMTLLEVDEAANAISGQVDPDANIIFGAAFDKSLQGVVRVSVVATGMDGASIAAIETWDSPRARTAPPAVMPEAAPQPPPSPVRATAPALQVAPAPARIAEAPQPQAVPQPAMLFDAPIAARPAAAAPAVKKIVDPMVAEASDQPLFGERLYGDDRRQKTGFLSLFGHSRKAARPAAPAMDSADEHEVDGAQELEIPSFLRRLAN
jgi:cell division protein FtsZ